MLTWPLAHLDPKRFGSPSRQAMLGQVDPRDLAAAALPALTTSIIKGAKHARVGQRVRWDVSRAMRRPL